MQHLGITVIALSAAIIGATAVEITFYSESGCQGEYYTMTDIDSDYPCAQALNWSSNTATSVTIDDLGDYTDATGYSGEDCTGDESGSMAEPDSCYDLDFANSIWLS